MTEISSEVHEASAQFRVEGVPMSHVSIEVGHLYFEDLAAGPDAISAMFLALAPWVELARRPDGAGRSNGSVRASTCFLVDDYFSQVAGPDQVVPTILNAAARAGVQIDYLARESGCAAALEVSPAELVLNRLIAEPSVGATGSRPPISETGWLTNGERSPATTGAEAMEEPSAWRPPRQTAARRHSIFVDVELFDTSPDGRRTWSCPMLAAVWQLLRLGLLRNLGRPVVLPAPVPEAWPTSWSDMPPVVRVNSQAQPFAAYRTFSLLPGRFLEVELATKTILGQFGPDNLVMDQVAQLAARGGVALPSEIVDRIAYGFIASGTADPA